MINQYSASRMIFIAASLIVFSASAQTRPANLDNAPPLDLTLSYYSKVLTAEGVVREARYQDQMLRRPGHVWLARVVPKSGSTLSAQTESGKSGQAVEQKNLSYKQEHLSEHQHFNPVLIPRHVQLEAGKTKIEFIDNQEKMTVTVPASEFANVNFDGSWENSYYLLDPQILKSMHLSKQISAVSTAKWYEREKNGIFQKILWDAQKQIPLIVESGDRAGNFYQRVEVKIAENTQAKLPWKNLNGYVHKEYADFLD
jgi:hypothetical protein